MARVTKRINSQDVAERAGVSRATVSYVLNGRNDVAIPEATRQRVLEAARAMNYLPDPAARALVTGKMHVVALWIAVLEPMIYTHILQEIERQMEGESYERVICRMQSLREERNRRVIVTRWPVDGILACDGKEHVRAFLETRGTGQHPAIVSIGPYAATDADDCVTVNLEKGFHEAVHHFAYRGRKRIAFLVSEWGNSPEEPRRRGYEKAMAEIGREKEIIPISKAGAQETYRYLSHYIQAHGCPDAMVCFSDDMALGAYRALRELGRKIPEDTALIGCDGCPELDYLDTPLASIAQPLEAMCQTGWEFLRQRIEEMEPVRERRYVELDPILQWRASAG